MTVNPYLHFDGNCEEALKFYEKALGAKRAALMRYGDAPDADETPKEMHHKILHARFTLGSDLIFASDAPPERCKAFAGFSLSLNPDTVEEAERFYRALSEKAEIYMPLQETFWAERFAMLKDQFGVPWLINCEKR
jgi:PhnB protein